MVRQQGEGRTVPWPGLARPRLQQAALIMLLLVGALLAALTLAVSGSFWLIWREAELARTTLAPQIATQQQQAVLAAQLSRQAEVILNSREREPRLAALRDAERLAGQFAAVLAPPVQYALDNAIHAVRRSAYRADLTDALLAAVGRNLARSQEALQLLNRPPAATGGTVSEIALALRLHWLLQEATFADDARLTTLEAEYRRLLASASAPALPEAEPLPGLRALYRDLAGSFDAYREIGRVRAEALRDADNAHQQLQGLSRSLAADAASRTRGMADTVLSYARGGLWVSGLGLALTILALGLLTLLLRRHVLQPLRLAAQALETVQRQRQAVTLPSALVQEVDDLSRAVETFGNALAELQNLAHVDPLTGLGNRRQLLDHLEHALALAQRSRHLGAVMYLDLDGFKQVNDQFGHRTGDRLLAEVAQRLRDCMRACDLVARVGGDEFTVILENLGQESDACLLAERLNQAFLQPFLDGQVQVGVSIGIAFFHDGDSSCETLLQRADEAMYLAKRGGKGRYHIWGQLSGTLPALPVFQPPPASASIDSR